MKLLMYREVTVFHLLFRSGALRFLHWMLSTATRDSLAGIAGGTSHRIPTLFRNVNSAF